MTNPLSLNRNFALNDSVASDSTVSDSVKAEKKEFLNAPVYYECKDSMVWSRGGNAYLYGDGKVNYENIELTASKITMNMDSSVVHATGSIDTTGMSVGLPIFMDGGTPYESDKMSYNFKTKKGIDREKLEEEMKKVSDRSVHIVKSGENLGSIARRYHVSVNQLKTWNKLKGTTIYPGQKLIVYSSGAPMAQAGNSNPVERSTQQKIHTVKSGENLSVIAKKYKCTITELKKWNNLKSNTLQIGQKLKVYPPSESSGATVIHTVKSGDNLWDISRKYGVTVEQIRSLNGLSSKAVLKIGQKLKIK